MDRLSSRALLWLIVLLWLVPMAAMAQTTKPAGLTARMWQALPPGQALVISLRLAHWKHASKTITNLLAAKKGQPSSRLQSLAANMATQKDPKAAVARLLLILGIVRSPKSAQEITRHLDTKHPIFHSLFSTDLNKARQILQLGLFDLKQPKRGATPLSTRFMFMTIPSTNPAALLTALTNMRRMQGVRWPAGEKTLGWPGAQILNQGRRLLTLIPRKGFLQVIRTSPLPSFLYAKKQRWNDVQLAHLKTLLKRHNTRRMTQARAHFLNNDSLLALYGHGANILQWGTLGGLQQAYMAIQYAAPKQRFNLLSQSYSVAVTGRFLLSSPAAEIEDTVITLSMKRGVLLQAVSSLTQSGQKAYEASLKGGANAIAVQGKKPLFSFAVRGNLKQLMASFVNPLPWVTASAHSSHNYSARRLPLVFRNCGISCNQSLWSGGHWYLLKGAIDTMKKAQRELILGFVPKRFRFVAPSLTMRPKGPPDVPMAMAMLADKLSPKQKRAFAALGNRSILRGWKISFQKAANGETCVLFGQGIDAAKIFGKCQLAKANKQPKRLYNMKLDLKRLHGPLKQLVQRYSRSGRRMPGLFIAMMTSNIMTKLRQLRGRAHITNKARVIQLQLVTNNTPKGWPVLPANKGTAPPRPLPQPWPYKGPNLCKLRLQHLHIELAKAIDSAPPEQKPKLVSLFWKRARPDIACLKKDKALRKLIAPLRAMWKRALRLK